ncbi:MAG TPA: hypothetical protein VGI46_18020 [Candidatus Acidoferrum sp.]|jgi:hypothetical protein
MLHTFFFILSLFMDYQMFADAVHSGLLLGLINGGVFFLAGTCAAIRGRAGRRHFGHEAGSSVNAGKQVRV